MNKPYQVPLIDCAASLSNAFDHVSAAVTNHHACVAYLAARVGRRLGLDEAELQRLAVAALLHDVATFSLQERRDTLRFEMAHSHQHTELGYRLLAHIAPLRGAAEIVRRHHTRWDELADAEDSTALAGHVLYLADRVDVLLAKHAPLLGQVEEICRAIRSQSGVMFCPDAVEAFLDLAAVEAFWLEAASPLASQRLCEYVRSPVLEVDADGLATLVQSLAFIVDFKSHYTATHSSGVAAIAAAMAECLGFSESELQQMRAAGYLHDLGKLGVGSEIIDKPGLLSDDDLMVIRTHSFYTRQILDAVPSLQPITDWAAPHHERLDGSGYPHHETAETLPLGARVVAIADVFAALGEDRPHRDRVPFRESIGVLQEMAGEGELDANLVGLLEDNGKTVAAAREAAQEEAAGEFARLMPPDD